MLNLALVQMCAQKGDVARNLGRIARYIIDAEARGCDIVVFPEMSVTGYLDPSRWPEAVLTRDDEAIADLAAMTRGTTLAAIAGFVERNPSGKPYIAQVVVANGKVLGFHRKQTVVDEEAEWFSPGEGGPVFYHQGVPFSLAICADIDEPAVFASGHAQGARVIFEVAAPGLYGEQAARDWASGYTWWRDKCHDQLSAYARDLGVFIAVATQTGRTIDEDFPGGGFVFDPTGTCTAETPDWCEQALYASIPMG